MKRVCLHVVIGGIMVSACVCANAQLPANFPQVSIWPNSNPAPGDFVGSLTVSNVPNLWSNWFAVLDNGTNPIVLNETNGLGTLACNGLFVSTLGAKGQTISFALKDDSFNVITTYYGGNGYTADNHDFQVMPNGHVLVECSDNNAVVDMSKLVPGGFPAALPTEFIIQEQDVDGNVVWQWRTLDHIPVTDSYQTLTNQNLGDYIHVNSVWFDEIDGTVILSCRNTSEVIKIDRATGNIVWRLNGKHNQFTFINGIPGNTDPANFQVQHNARRWQSTGNLSVFDNGYSQHSDPIWNFTRPYTRGVEYALDEVNKTATLIWAFRHNPDIITYNGGSVQLLSDGHFVMTWGGAGNNSLVDQLAMTEVDAQGNLVCDVLLPQDGVAGNFARLVWPVESTYTNVTIGSLYPYDTYVFNQGANITGVTLDVGDLDADMYNGVTVSRQPFAPVIPRFLGKAPRFVAARVEMTRNLVYDIAGQLSFDVNSLGFIDPTNTTVYYRPTAGQGLFVPLPTTYDWVTYQLQVDMPGFGEFAFGFPDEAEVPCPPVLAAPVQGATVNQTAPIAFLWTPTGFVADYNLQISTDPGFGTLVVDVPDLTVCYYTLSNVIPNATYYWRVNEDNDGGTSDWATNSFTTVPPFVQVTVPGTGVAWQRGLSPIIQWNANVGGNIALDLYKSGSLVKTIVTNAANIPAYQWPLSVSLVPGSDYTIKLRSTTNSAISAVSPAFSIVDAPTINPKTVTVLANGSAQFSLTAPGAATATVLGSTDLSTWQVLQVVPVTSGAAVFTDTNAPAYPTRFYRVRVP